MEVMMLRLIRIVLRTIYFISSLFARKRIFHYQAVVVSNCDYKTIEQITLLNEFDAHHIKYKFFITTQRKTSIGKFFANVVFSFYLPHGKDIIVYDFCMPLYCVDKRPEQRYIQLWHANGIYKQFGIPNFYHDRPGELADRLYRIMPIHSTYDVVFVSSEKCIEYFMKAFHVLEREKYIVCNNITLQLLMDLRENTPKKVYEPNKKNIVFAPTFNFIQPHIYKKLEESLVALGRENGIEVSCKYILHPKEEKATNSKNVLLLEADVLVTDYSSICFEASAIGVKSAFIRDETLEPLPCFLEVAKKVYADPVLLAKDIITNNLIDHELDQYISIPSKRQADILLDLLDDLKSKQRR